MEEPGSIIFDGPYVPIVDGTVGMVPFTVTSLIASSGDCFYFCMQSLTCFWVGQHQVVVLTESFRLQLSAFLFQAHTLLFLTAFEWGKRKMTSMVFIWFSRMKAGLKEEVVGLLPMILRGSLAKASMKPAILSFLRSQVRQKPLYFSFATFHCVIVLFFIFFLICPQLIV